MSTYGVIICSLACFPVSLKNSAAYKRTTLALEAFKVYQTPTMQATKDTFNAKEVFINKLHAYHGRLDSYFEVCDKLDYQIDLFSRNSMASTPPAEIVELEDLKSTSREMAEQAVRCLYFYF